MFVFTVCLKKFFQQNVGGTVPEVLRGYITNVCCKNKMYTKLRHSSSICEVEINRKNINPSCSKPEIV